MNTEVNYRGSGIIVSESVSKGTETTITQVRPYRMNSGWMYLHLGGGKPWITYHIQKVEKVVINQNDLQMTDEPQTWLNIDTGYGEHLSIFLNGATLDMLAEAIENARNLAEI